jgi:hypothetical protein
MSAYGNSTETAEIIYTHLNRMCEEDWNIYAKSLKLSKDFIYKLKDQLRFTIIGILLFI